MSRSYVLISTISVIALSFSQLGFTQTSNRSQNQPKILIESVAISGTRSVDSAELAEIADRLSGPEFSEDTDELGDQIRNEFQNHGFYTAKVQKLEVKTIDALAVPKTVRLEAQVDEGMLCRLSEIVFRGEHAIGPDELRTKLPIKIGDVFTKSKVGGGLVDIQSLYSSRGFLDETMVPNATLASASTVRLDLEVEEGPQYRMDKFEIVGQPEVAGKLQSRWTLEAGAVFDATYVKTFLEANSSLLPTDFTASDGLALLKDCDAATVSVHLHLQHDPQHDALDRAKPADCALPVAKKKKTTG